MSESLRPAIPVSTRKTDLIIHYLSRYKRLMAYGLFALVAVDALEILPPIILKNAIDGIVALKPYSNLLIFAAAYLFTLFLQGICRWGWRVFLIRSSMLAGRDLRSDFVEHLFSLPASFYDKNRVGDLMSLANGDVESVRSFIGPGLLTLADACFYILTVPLVMFWLSPKLALLSFMTMPIIPFIVFKLENLIHTRYKASQNHFSTLSAMAQENLNGIRVIKAFAREDKTLGRFRKLGEEYIRLNMRLSQVHSSFGPLMDFFASFGLVILIYYGGRFTAEEAVTLGTFVAFQRYIQKMIWPMMALGFGVSFYQRATASSDRLKDIFKIKSDIPAPKNPALPGGFKSGEKTKGKIEIRDLSFAYPGASSVALKKINLTIEPGTRVAFVGGIGCGKSTLLSLIPRLYPAPDGTIFLDGVDVNRWPIEVLRSQIGFVAQDVFLFSENVFENIAFGLDAGATEKNQSTVYRSVASASVADDISGLVRGYDTQLGERGVNLSGGQKQRVSLARAIAKDPAVLILDDALSAVDVKTEEAILGGLRSRDHRNTELIAAHRISTVQEADRIFVLHQGEIVQEGTHQQLISKKSGIYYRYYEQQRLKEDLERYMKEMDESRELR